VRSEQLADPAVAAAVSVATTLDDAELAAFLNRYFDRIVGEEARMVRFTTTDTPNTVYVEYEASEQVRQRVLVTVRDVIHVEWVIRARYEAVNTAWRKVEGGGLADPEPQRLYEWEEELGQWVLKERLYNNG